jgi:photosystem II stability/assembly factor-like uncharacterized protein
LIVRFVLWTLLTLSVGLSASAQEWQRLGPPGGMVITLGAGAHDVVYLGTADGHVFAREGPSSSWELRGRIGRRTDAVVSRLLVDPSQDSAVFAAVWNQQPGSGGGVFHSDDAGKTWTLLGLQEEAVRALEISPSQPKVIIAGTRSGVFRSTDAGTNWERISPAGDAELRNLDSLAIDPRDENIIYAGTYHLPWKTTDGGKTWRPVINGLIDDSDIMSLRIDATKPERMFLSACSGIYRSENQGESWTKLQGIPYAARRTQAIVQDPENAETLYAGTTEGLWVTQDAGESWNRTTPQDWVINSVAVVAGYGKVKEQVLIGTESRGALSSLDHGKTFVPFNDGFAHQVVRQMIVDPRDKTHLAMLNEREGMLLWESRDAGQSWISLPLIRQQNTKTAQFAAEQVEGLSASPWGWMAHLYNGQLWLLDEKQEKWREWKLRIPVIPTGKRGGVKQGNDRNVRNTSEIVSPTGSVLDFSATNAYVAAKQRVLRCNAAGTCAALKSFDRVEVFSALQVSADGSTLRVVADGKLATSRDGGQTAVWSDLPVSSKAVLWVHSSELRGGQKLFLGTTEGLFESEDDGRSWQREEQGLPRGQVERFLQGDNFLVVSLREGGMYVSRDNGKTWKRVDQDAERSRSNGLVEVAPGIVIVGSQSEGVLRWQGVE